MRTLSLMLPALLLGLILTGCDSGSSSEDAPAAQPSMMLLGRSTTGVFNEGAAEIPAYDSGTRRAFVVNGQVTNPRIDVLDLANPAAPVKIGEISAVGVGGVGAAANSVSVRNGIVAVAIEASPKQNPGVVAFYNANSNFAAAVAPVSTVMAGALPDMLTFTPDGTRVLVANEGEPNGDYSVDPVGSVSIINVSDINNPTAQTAGFNTFDAQKANLIAAGIRIYGPGMVGGVLTARAATVSQDLEPEYIAVSPDSTTAFVTVQEANAIAEVDIATATVTRLTSLGLKNHATAGNELDASDRDGPANDAAINIRNWPIFGMYQPDTIQAYSASGQTFLVMANEGDSRAYGCAVAGCNEEVRVGAGSYVLNPVIFPDATTLKQNPNLGRLTVTNMTGDSDLNGSFEQIHVLGARSFSIRRTDGSLVFDSGSDFENITAGLHGLNFNNNNSETAADNRSDNKGSEPEALAIGAIGSRTYAFVGLERMSGLMVYDITNPLLPFFVTYAINRDLTPMTEAQLRANIETGNSTAGDLGPEGIVFVPAADNATGQPLIIVANEISGTTSIWQLNNF